jgi:hypothetical protein
MSPVIVDMEAVPLGSASTVLKEDRIAQIHAVIILVQRRDVQGLYFQQ